MSSRGVVFFAFKNALILTYRFITEQKTIIYTCISVYAQIVSMYACVLFATHMCKSEQRDANRGLLDDQQSYIQDSLRNYGAKASFICCRINLAHRNVLEHRLQ